MEVPDPLQGSLDPSQVLPQARVLGIAFLNLAQPFFEHHHQVVEIVGDPSRHPTQGFHPLGVEQGLLQDRGLILQAATLQKRLPCRGDGTVPTIEGEPGREEEEP
jgi:hypothetical protein